MGYYMKRRKYELGQLYKIKFYDHCIGSQDKMVCQVVGWCIKDDTEHLVLTPWIVNTDDHQTKKDNVEPFSIIKSTVISSRKYS